MDTSVRDSDISKAFVFTNASVNPELFCDQSAYTTGYLLLSAHNLVMNLRASSQGMNGQFNFLQTGKSVGSVSESFGIPQRILDNPEWAVLAKTNYGAQYLAMILPQLVGQIFTVRGTTRS